jgi:16S rRNA (cytosine967-C5)-methyltransferase
VSALVAPDTGTRARRAALAVLRLVRQGKRFERALDRVVTKLPDADRRLAHELAAGVLRQRRRLDEQLAGLVSRDWSRVSAPLQDVLRLGAYQLTHLDRVPAHAAVGTSVALAKRIGGARAAGFVNAVLRRFPATPGAAPLQPEGPAELASRHSHPDWLVQRWLRWFGLEQTEALLRWNNTAPRLVAQPARTTLEDLESRWQAAGINLTRAPFQAGLVLDRTRPAELPGYLTGDFIIQDPAQAMLTRFAALPSQLIVYDACAAPGGKTIALGRGIPVIAGEINPRRARRLAQNLARAGSGREHVVVADARQPPIREIDVVLLDVPCTGTGTLARHPEARWRVTPAALEQLASLQSQLLESTAALIRPGGLLVYSTCSVEPEENKLQVEHFLAGHPEFQREPVTSVPQSLLSPTGDLTILPQLHGMDGAYAARLRRVG